MARRLNIILTAALMLTCFSASAQNCIPEKPGIQTSVYDYTSTLGENDADALENKLIAYSDSTSTQIVVVFTKSLCGEAIAMYATELAHSWGIGQKGKDNGVLLLVAPNEREVFIATGYGVEGLLTDALSKRIIERIILPAFRSGDYYAGVDKGTDAIFQVLMGEFKADSKEEDNAVAGLIVFGLFVLLVVIIASIFSKNKNSGTGGPGKGGKDDLLSDILLTSILLGSGGRSSRGGFGSGGFGGGFGGGGFGGGGAGGSW